VVNKEVVAPPTGDHRKPPARSICGKDSWSPSAGEKREGKQRRKGSRGSVTSPGMRGGGRRGRGRSDGDANVDEL
jgi:hypothetical protein